LLRRCAVAGVSALAASHAGLFVAYTIVRAMFGHALWVIDTAADILPWLFVPVLLWLLAALLLRFPRVLTIASAVMVILFLLTYGHLYLPRWPVRTRGPEFTVLTHNVLGSNENVDALLVSIDEHKPDFFGLRELAGPMAQALEPHLAGKYPHHRIEPGCGFWSRYPILAYERFQLVEGEGSWAQRLVLDVEGRTVVVISLHPRSPPAYGFPLSELPARLPEALADEGRDADLQALVARLEGIEGPLVVIGDFNATDQYALYGPLTRRLRDAHRESGWGMGFTYSRWPEVRQALWRIDYVFHSPELVAVSAGTGDYAGSDHRPVIARLAFRAEAGVTSSVIGMSIAYAYRAAGFESPPPQAATSPDRARSTRSDCPNPSPSTAPSLVAPWERYP
jgi:vancomycin resistance protein VanJ